jgi:signal transduction histidine kinase
VKQILTSRIPPAPGANSRLVLIAGFGGLLLLTAFAGADGMKALQDIENSNDRIREEFLLRTQVLERIRADLYRSGTDLRDYLLEPAPGKAEGHRYTLVETRRDMDDALEKYRQLLSGGESQPFEVLTRELAAYWQVMEPTFDWTAKERQRDGYPFLRDVIFPRRSSILGIASQIGRLNEAQLESGRAVVRQTFGQLRNRLLIAIGLAIGLGLLLAWLSIRSILRLETTAATHYMEINQARTELKQLSARLLQAQEEERRAISRELHDEVGQSLSGVLLEMANLTNLIRGAEQASQKAEEIKRQLEGSIRVVRSMALLLRPSMLDDLGLVPALEWQAREASKHRALSVHVAAENVSDNLDEGRRTCIYRVVQEALHNIVQHADAREVNITVKQDPERLQLSIQDNGKGFDVRRERGMGLIGIEERVGGLGGTLTIKSAQGQGTELRVTLPLESRE